MKIKLTLEVSGEEAALDLVDDILRDAARRARVALEGVEDKVDISFYGDNLLETY